MRNFWTYTLLLLVSLAGGALLWGLVHALWLPPVPHHKFVKYGALLTAAVILTLWARHRITRESLGLQAGYGSILRVAPTSFFVTVVLLAPLWATLLGLDARVWDTGSRSMENLMGRMAAYLAISVAVATLEELYFRGLLLSRVLKCGLPLTASALLYAGIHFLNPTPDPSLVGHWNAGVTLLADAALEMPAQWLDQMSRLCLLFLIGLGLGMLRLRFQSLALCIGSHAAMVFSLKTFQLLTSSDSPTFAWLGTDPLGGWAGTLWVGAIVLGFFVLSRTSKVSGKFT